MNQIDKKAISSHLLEAMNREELRVRDVAKYLNLNPCYVTMSRNEKYFDSMSNSAWQRLDDWHNSRDKISAFRIPEGEEIFMTRQKGPTVKTSPEAPSPAPGVKTVPVKSTVPGKKKGRTRKSKKVKPALQTTEQRKSLGQLNEMETLLQEIENETLPDLLTRTKYNGKRILLIESEILPTLRSRLDNTEKDTAHLHQISEKQIKRLDRLFIIDEQILPKLIKRIDDVEEKLHIIEDEILPVLQTRVKDTEDGLSHLVTIPKQEEKKNPGIVIFQRNIYKP